jgi:hypothetical protein
VSREAFFATAIATERNSAIGTKREGRLRGHCPLFFVRVRVLVIVIECWTLAALGSVKPALRKIIPNAINRHGHPGSDPDDYAAFSITITRTRTIFTPAKQAGWASPTI